MIYTAMYEFTSECNCIYCFSYTQWFDDDVISALPLPSSEVKKTFDSGMIVRVPPGDEVIDPFMEYYRPCELTSLLELFCSNMPHSIRYNIEYNAVDRILSEEVGLMCVPDGGASCVLFLLLPLYQQRMELPTERSYGPFFCVETMYNLNVPLTNRAWSKREVCYASTSRTAPMIGTTSP